MPTTPNPYGYNRTRYAKVPKRAKSGGICGVLALALLAIPATIMIAIGGLVAQNI